MLRRHWSRHFFKKSILVINILANGSYFSANITMVLCRGYHNRHYNSKISLRQTLISRNSDILFVLLLYKKRKIILVTMGINQCSAKAKMNNSVCRDWRTDIIPRRADEMNYLWLTDRWRSSLNQIKYSTNGINIQHQITSKCFD